MRGMFLIARRELAAYLNSYWGYAIVAAMLVLDGLFFNAFAVTDKAKYSADVMHDFFYFSFGVTATASVFLTMRLVAEERQTGTIALLDSSPLAPWQVVGGKYASAMVLMCALIVATLYMPALVFINGKVSTAQIFAGYCGLFLVGAATTAVGTFASTISRNQLVSGLVGAIFVVFFVMAWLIARVVDAPLRDVVSYLSFYNRHFQHFARGQISSESVVFFLSIAFLFLMLSTRFLAARRWK